MARIHRVTGSTRYLINGMKPVRGNKPATYGKVRYFYDHYEQILAETDVTIGRQYDEMIDRISTDETRLDRQLQENIARQTIVVDKNLEELRERIADPGNFLPGSVAGFVSGSQNLGGSTISVANLPGYIYQHPPLPSKPHHPNLLSQSKTLQNQSPHKSLIFRIGAHFEKSTFWKSHFFANYSTPFLKYAHCVDKIPIQGHISLKKLPNWCYLFQRSPVFLGMSTRNQPEGAGDPGHTVDE